MASRTSSAALLLTLNLLFFTLVSSTHYPDASKATCPMDALKLGVCAKVLNLVPIVVGQPPKGECCSLISGLVDLQATVCLCTALKANVLGINLDIPVSLSLVLNKCQKNLPEGFNCA